MKKTTLCYIRNNGSYLMLYRNRKENDDNAGKWLGIGGKFEPGETADECIVREVREETGLILNNLHFYGVVEFRSDAYEYEDMYLYTSDDFIPKDPEQAEEFRQRGCFDLPECCEGELHWIDERDLKNLPMWEGDSVFLNKILDGEKSINLTMYYSGDHLLKVVEK